MICCHKYKDNVYQMNTYRAKGVYANNIWRKYIPIETLTMIYSRMLEKVLLVWIFCFWYQHEVGSQYVNVTIFTESKCKYCTRLLREQIWPFYVQRPGVMNLQVLPIFSKIFTKFHSLTVTISFDQCIGKSDQCNTFGCTYFMKDR